MLGPSSEFCKGGTIWDSEMSQSKANVARLEAPGAGRDCELVSKGNVGVGGGLGPAVPAESGQAASEETRVGAAEGLRLLLEGGLVDATEAGEAGIGGLVGARVVGVGGDDEGAAHVPVRVPGPELLLAPEDPLVGVHALVSQRLVASEH